jgi:hypothetical protein
MGAGNGHGPSAFERAALVGQVVTVKNWSCQVVATCNCEAKEAVLVVLGMLGQCPSCKRLFQITQIGFDGKTGSASIVLGLVVPQADPAAAPQGVLS